MKKCLYGTTSLVSVGLLVGTVNPVEAAEKITLGVSGYAQYFVAYVNQSEIAQSGQSDVDVKNNGEIWFKGSTKLDNGISIGVDVQLEAFQSGDQVDEQYMWVESASLGKLIVGDENGAAYLLHLGAPFAGIDLDTGTIEGFAGFYANNTGGTLFNSPLGTTLGRALDNDSAKITYLSPRIFGLQAGVSYTPRFAQDTNSAADNAVPHDGWEGGLQYLADFSGLGIGAMFGFKHADGADTLKILGQPESDIEVWKASGRITYQGFALGGGWLRQSSGLAAANTSIKGSSWIVSAAYTTDAWGIGTGYFDGHSEDLVNVAGKDEHDKWIVEGKYVLGPGVDLVGALFGFDLDAEGTALQAATGVGNGTDNDGWGAIAGVKMSF